MSKLMPVIGVITRRKKGGFVEPDYFRDLYREGSKLGALVYFFSEEDVRLKDNVILGFAPDKRRWRQTLRPWPDVVIDRRRSKWTRSFLNIRRKKLFPYTSSKFAFKDVVTRELSRIDEVSKWIPQTSTYSSDRLSQMMDRFPLVYVKPGNGTAGGSVVRIAKDNNHWIAWGRAKGKNLRKARFANREQVINWVNTWVRTERVRDGKFIVQQGLNLELIPGRVVDNRLLIQKNKNGKWELTGLATRIGGPNSPTTNLLYDDGKARKFDVFMRERFGPEKAAEIREECVRMAHSLVAVFERKYGPMMEFGMDVGVDVDGHVWLIEANPKPSRDVFLKTGERSTYLKAVRRPLEYALYVAKQPT
ncbi:YheC/YheD family protein [Cohnella soli]|uniref:YheC/YheD family protein n=1 Tax=Cohnella soli TaxID=425005 RepID=A0ABW0I4I3_9BACL